MKTKLLAILFALGFACAAFAENSVGPSNQILCNQMVFQQSSSTTLLTLLSGQSGKTIAICGWTVTNSTATPQTFGLFTGTGTNCSSTSALLIPAFNITQNAPATDHTSVASISLASGNNLCVQSSATSLQIGIWVSQF